MFSVEGARFAHTPDTREAALYENQENAVKAVYRFAARNYPQRQDWRH